MLDGASRGATARAGGMDRQTLREWVIRYNEEGIKGLRDRPRSGRRPRLSPEQRGELAQLVEDGPDVAEHGVVRWRCQDLKVVIRRRFGVELAERQIERILKQLKFARYIGAAAPPQGRRGHAAGFLKKLAPRRFKWN